MHVIDVQHDCHQAFDYKPVYYCFFICLVQRSSLGYADVHVAARFVGQGKLPHLT